MQHARLGVARPCFRARSQGGETGPNPTDRGKAGTKRHLVVDGKGMPPGLTTSGANRHDSRMSAPTLDAVPRIRGRPGRPRCRSDKPHADKAATIAAWRGLACRVPSHRRST